MTRPRPRRSPPATAEDLVTLEEMHAEIDRRLAAFARARGLPFPMPSEPGPGG